MKLAITVMYLLTALMVGAANYIGSHRCADVAEHKSMFGSVLDGIGWPVHVAALAISHEYGFSEPCKLKPRRGQ